MGQQEDEELSHLWSLFKESPEDIKKRRQEITEALIDERLSSFPTTLSVSTAFDELFQCFSLGGQVKNYYRYGGISYCAEQREKLWFALKHGSFMEGKPLGPEAGSGELEKAQKIQEFYKRRWLETKARGSSEDIWQERTQMLNRPFKE